MQPPISLIARYLFRPGASKVRIPKNVLVVRKGRTHDRGPRTSSHAVKPDAAVRTRRDRPGVRMPPRGTVAFAYMATATPATTDPYRLKPEDVIEPPRTFGAIMKRIGPGIILCASIVGSGELIATTTLGAQVGFAA